MDNQQADKSIKHGTYAMVLESLEGGSTIASSAHPLVVNGKDNAWDVQQDEGKLAVDVAQNDTHVFVISTMAGSVPERIEVYVHNDLLTVRGERSSPMNKKKNIEYFFQECFWGTFSRTIVLPTDVKGDLAKAEYRNGILIVSIPKRHVDAKIPVVIVEE